MPSSPSARGGSVALRSIFVWLHRWTGLVLAGFLIIVGLTGSLLAFNMELERWISPQLFASRGLATPRRDLARLDLARLDLAGLAERAEALAPQAEVAGVDLSAPDQVVVAVKPRAEPGGKAAELAFDQIFLDPLTGEELGRRKRGDLSQGLVNLMPFIYDLHWELALGETGMWILGVAALVWTIDCFNGFYLTLPVALAAFWSRWKPAWLVKRRAGFFRLNFDLHRAGGLWLWPMLFIFAWSSVMMDLRPVYDVVMNRIFDYRSPREEFSNMAPASERAPRLDWRAAQETGERYLAAEASRRGFAVERATALYRFGDAYSYVARTSLDFTERGGSAYVLLDANSGALRSISLPSGQRSGNTVTTWMYALHMANVFGLPYRIFVCLLGVAIAILSGTGVYIWLRKRQARLASAARRREAISGAIAEAVPQLVTPSVRGGADCRS